MPPAWLSPAVCRDIAVKNTGARSTVCRLARAFFSWLLLVLRTGGRCHTRYPVGSERVCGPSREEPKDFGARGAQKMRGVQRVVALLDPPTSRHRRAAALPPRSAPPSSQATSYSCPLPCEAGDLVAPQTRNSRHPTPLPPPTPTAPRSALADCRWRSKMHQLAKQLVQLCLVCWDRYHRAGHVCTWQMPVHVRPAEPGRVRRVHPRKLPATPAWGRPQPSHHL